MDKQKYGTIAIPIDNQVIPTIRSVPSSESQMTNTSSKSKNSNKSDPKSVISLSPSVPSKDGISNELTIPQKISLHRMHTSLAYI